MWSDELANMAEKWVQECIFDHGGLNSSDFVNVGQNCFLTTAGEINYTLAFDKWYAEKNNYDFDTQTCRYDCGHYTQVIGS